MELRRLRYFLVTAEELHVARAAERLGIAQPALSQQLKVLETALGARLFERVGRGIRLSAVGASFLPEARAAVLQAERAMCSAQAAARGELGQLEIGYVASAMLEYDLPRLVQTFRHRYPAVRLRLHRLPVHEQVLALVERRLDLGWVRGIGTPHGSALDDRLRCHLVSSTEMLLALPSGHRCAGREIVELGELAGDPFIVLQDSAEPGYFARSTNALCHAAGFAPNVVLQIGELVSLMGLVAAGIGVSFVPAPMRQIAGANVVFRPVTPAPGPVQLHLARHRDAHSAVVARFLEVAGLDGMPRQ